MEVRFGIKFSQEYPNFPKFDKNNIALFIHHVTHYGLSNLAGRNKSSDDVPTDDPNWFAKVSYAQQHKLWHYHIGIPNYIESSNGELVSEYILHYIRNDDEDWIKIVDMSAHPPFMLPSEDYLA